MIDTSGMESSTLDTIIDFVRVRQLNIALAGVLTLVYLIYQYWGDLFKGAGAVEGNCRVCNDSDARRSRSRSRSASRSGTRTAESPDSRHRGGRGRRGYKHHCPDCGWPF